MTDIHGTSTVRATSATKTVTQVRSAVIALACTAPIHLLDAANQTLNEQQLILGELDAAKFVGPDVDGFTARQAITGIHDHGAGIVIMVNVFDPETHKLSVAAEAVALSGDVGTLANTGAYNQEVKSQDGNTTYVEGTDYSFDRTTATVTRLSGGAILADATLQVDYDYADPSQVTAADIIGTTTAEGVRTGMQAFLNAKALFGFGPKIWIAPGFSTDATVAAELVSKATQFKGDAFIDAPLGTTVAEALAGRNDSSINFAHSSEHAHLCFPHIEVAGNNADTRLEGMSARAAGLRALVDKDLGFWFSMSNKTMSGVLGTEIPLYADMKDPNSETNLLNDAGICTVFNAHGSGFRFWGNRSSAFPASTDVLVFQAVRRTFDLVDESIEEATLQFVDRPITSALIDSIVSTCNGYIDGLISDGALKTGSRCWYDADKNPAEDLAAGKLTISRVYMASTPARTITHEATVDIQLLQNISLAA